MNLVQVYQGGLVMGQKEYYLDNDSATVAIRDAYRTYMTKLFERCQLGDFAKIDWHVLWMVAGGFAIGTALNKTGLASALVEAIPFGSWSAIAVLIIAGLLGWLLSNFIANSSAANLLVPILAVVGTAMSEQLGAFGGVTTLLVCVAASTSFAMLLPISTPPNAIACSTGLIKTNDMAKVGLIVGLVGIAIAYAVILIFPFG